MSSKGWKTQLRAMNMFWWALSLECRGCPFCSAFNGKVKQIGNSVMYWLHHEGPLLRSDLIPFQKLHLQMWSYWALWFQWIILDYSFFSIELRLYFVTAFPPLITEKWSGHPSKATFSINFTNYLAVLHTFSP